MRESMFNNSIVFKNESLENSSVELEANSKENPSLLLFSRIDNPKIQDQIIDLLKRAETYKVNQEDIEIMYDENGDISLDENGNVKVKKIQSKYAPKTEEDLRQTLRNRKNEVASNTPISFDEATLTTGNHQDGVRENISLFFEAGGSDLQKSIIEAHEKGHVLRPYEGDFFRNYFSEGFDFSFVTYSQEDFEQAKIKYNWPEGTSYEEALREKLAYLSDGREVAERMSQLKNYFGMKGDEVFTIDHLRYAKEHYIQDTGLDNEMRYFFQAITKEKEEKFIELINRSGI